MGKGPPKRGLWGTLWAIAPSSEVQEKQQIGAKGETKECEGPEDAGETELPSFPR